MYSENDMTQINGKIKKNVTVLSVVAVILLAGFVAALVLGIEWLTMVMGPLLFLAVAYGFTAYIIPNANYRRFLKDAREGLSREIRGSIVEISATEEMQDGVRVLPVRIHLADEDDERFLYLNVSKKDQFAKTGDSVRMKCYGRHILSWTAM